MTDIDVLAVSPHPDDAELGCAGSLILAVGRGMRVAIADLSEGEMSSRGSPGLRAAEKTRAAERLGLCARYSVGLPDGRIGADPQHRLPLIELIRRTRPRLVLAPYKEDRHPDHVAASRLVVDACFWAGVSKIGAGQPHRPERVYQYMIHQPFSPSFVLDISSVWDRKLAVISEYRSQFFDPERQAPTAISGAAFLRHVEASSVVLGAMIGARHGEAFHLPGPVPLTGLPGLDGDRPAPGGLPPYSVF